MSSVFIPTCIGLQYLPRSPNPMFTQPSQSRPSNLRSTFYPMPPNPSMYNHIHLPYSTLQPCYPYRSPRLFTCEQSPNILQCILSCAVQRGTPHPLLIAFLLPSLPSAAHRPILCPCFSGLREVRYGSVVVRCGG